MLANAPSNCLAVDGSDKMTIKSALPELVYACASLIRQVIPFPSVCPDVSSSVADYLTK